MRDWFMSWDDEFKEISKKFGLPDSRIYLETLKWKEFCAQLTYETYKDVYNQLEKDIKNSKIIEIMKNGKFGRYVWKASGEAACCIHITRTLVDVLLQIINKTILEEEILEHKVTLSNVKNKLKDKSALKIIEKLKILEESEEFNYIRNLDNKLKHQNLVKTDYVQTNLINKNNTRKGLKFQSFKINYGPEDFKEFQEKWIDTILNIYRGKIAEMIEGVGNELNKYLLQHNLNK
jgi:hypothetical protein